MNSDPDQFIDRLKARLASPLPGQDVRRRLAPELSHGRQFGPAPTSARRAAVVALLTPAGTTWNIPFIVRPDHMPEHAGQISFPGGMVEPGESNRAAALREVGEELGVDAGIQLVGHLSELYVFVSDFCVTPWIGVLDREPLWKPNPHEVSELLEVSVDYLLTTPVRRFLVQRGPLAFEAPYYGWQRHKIWGATAMILSELLEVVGGI